MLARLSPLLFLLTAACATTGATYGSGVGDTYLAHAPWYAGARTAPLPTGARVGVLPVLQQAGAAQPAMFDPFGGAASPTAQLLAEMNAYLDSLVVAGGATPVRLVDGARASAVAPASLGVPPDVRFGCITELDLPDEECADRGDGALGRDDRERMKLAVGRPSAAWVTWATETMQAQGATHALVLTLEVGQYLTRQTGLRGAKSVELGTGHAAWLPWLTSLETPVQVLQVTGVLVDRTGRAVRIGAEGLMAKRTSLLASSAGLQALLTPEDLEAIRTRVREDLPGRPLVWKEAMRQLAHRLTMPGSPTATTTSAR